MKDEGTVVEAEKSTAKNNAEGEQGANPAAWQTSLQAAFSSFHTLTALKMMLWNSWLPTSCSSGNESRLT